MAYQDKKFLFEIYDSHLRAMFSQKTIDNANEYYKNNKVLFLEEVSCDEYIAIVQGEKRYITTIKDYDCSTYVTCNCPCNYFCKHACAAIIAIRNDDIKPFYHVHFKHKERKDYYLCTQIVNESFEIINEKHELELAPMFNEEGKKTWNHISFDPDCDRSFIENLDKIVEEHENCFEDEDIYTYEFRQESLNKLNLIELTKENSKDFNPDDVLFLTYCDGQGSRGEMQFLMKDKKMYYLNYCYGKEFKRDEAFWLVPNWCNEWGFDWTSGEHKYFEHIYLGSDNNLFVKKDIYKRYLKYLNEYRKNMNSDDEFDIEYNYRAFCCWIEAAIDYINELDYYVIGLDEFYDLYSNLYDKKVKVIFHDNSEHIGIFGEIFEEESEIMVGGMCIAISEIKDMILIDEIKNKS